jgi:hypothetical protein
MGAKKLIVEYPHVFTFEMKRWECHALTPLLNVKGNDPSKRLSNFYHVIPWVRESLKLQLIKLKNRK